MVELWGPSQHLIIIFLAVGVLLVVLLTIVCLVSPHCWCHKHCLCIPRYPGEGYRHAYRKYDAESAYKELADLNPSSIYKEPGYKILTGSTETCSIVNEKSEGTALNESPARQYDSVGSSRAPEPDYRRYYSRKPVKSLEVDISWNHRDGTAKVHLKTLHLTRVKRRKGLQVHVELVTDKRPFKPFSWSRGDGVVAEYRTEIREQTAQVTLEETFTFDWVSISGRGTLRFSVHAAEGATVTDVIGRAELPLQELDTTARRSIRLYLTSPLPVIKGECQVSLSYLPTAEKLSVIVGDYQHIRGPKVKEEEHDVFVQMGLLYKHRVLDKKKTSFRRVQSAETPGLVANHTFDLPPDRLTTVCLLINFKRLAMESDSDQTPASSEKGSLNSADNNSEIFSDDDNMQSLPSRDVTIGSVIIGLESGLPDAQAHWSEMIASPRLPVVQWHHVL